MKATVLVLSIMFTSLSVFAEAGVIVHDDLYKANIRVICAASSEGDRGEVNEDGKTIFLTEGNQSTVFGEVILAPTKAESRKIYVEVFGSYRGDGTQAKELSINISTELAGHSVKGSGTSKAEIAIDKAYYFCNIVAPAK